MGRRASESENDEWTEPEDDDESLELEEDFEASEDVADDELRARVPRTTGTQRLLARRLIEQAREKRELSQRLADFDDYQV